MFLRCTFIQLSYLLTHRYIMEREKEKKSRRSSIWFEPWWSKVFASAIGKSNIAQPPSLSDTVSNYKLKQTAFVVKNKLFKPMPLWSRNNKNTCSIITTTLSSSKLTQLNIYKTERSQSCDNAVWGGRCVRLFFERIFGVESYYQFWDTAYVLALLLLHCVKKRQQMAHKIVSLWMVCAMNHLLWIFVESLYF